MTSRYKSLNRKRKFRTCKRSLVSDNPECKRSLWNASRGKLISRRKEMGATATNHLDIMSQENSFGAKRLMNVRELVHTYLSIMKVVPCVYQNQMS